MNDNFPFELKPLPYDYTALAPVIDETTLHFHHDKHLNTYVENLNKALENHPDLEQLNLKKLIQQADTAPGDIRTALKNNAGGVYNHQLYFECMGKGHPIKETMKKAIEDSFGSYDEWKSQMKQAALTQFGSGWAWLVMDRNKKLKVINLPNQDTPLPLDLSPLLLVDVWEHAYYLQYQNKRAEYLDQWFDIINWDTVEELYNKAL